MAKASKRVGRPTKAPKSGERVSLGLRVTADIKRKLDRAAEKSGRSQSQEAEMRLEASFAPEHERLNDMADSLGEKIYARLMAESGAPGVGPLLGRLKGSTEDLRRVTEHLRRVEEQIPPKEIGNERTQVARDVMHNLIVRLEGDLDGLMLTTDGKPNKDAIERYLASFDAALDAVKEKIATRRAESEQPDKRYFK